MRDYPFMPLDRRRLLTSEAWSAAAEEPYLALALLSLWCEAWDQVPAGSLPDSDRVLFRLSHVERHEDWTRIRERALAGFERCADGRLYHATVCEKALEAWIDKLGNRLKGGAGNAKRWGGTFDPTALRLALHQALALLARLRPTHRLLARRKGLEALQGSGGGAPPRGTGEGGPSTPGAGTRSTTARTSRKARGGARDVADTGVPQVPGAASLGDLLGESQGDRSSDRSCDPSTIASKEKGYIPLPPLPRSGGDCGQPSADGAGTGGAVARWWTTPAGIAAQGHAIGHPPPPEYAGQEGGALPAAWPEYRAAVFAAMGPGPWRLADARASLSERASGAGTGGGALRGNRRGGAAAGSGGGALPEPAGVH